MHKKYDYRLVVSYRPYKIRDLCRLYREKKLHEQTVRQWVNDGKLKAIWDGKTILIYGAIFKQFLLDNNNSRKRTLEFNQFRCGKCKQINSPLNNTIVKLTTGRGGSIHAFAHCANCNHLTNRHYKANQKPQIIESFTVQHDEVVLISDSSCSTSNAHINNSSKIAISEPLQNKPPDKNQKTTNATSKTNIKRKANAASTSNTHIKQQLELF